MHASIVKLPHRRQPIKSREQMGWDRARMVSKDTQVRKPAQSRHGEVNGGRLRVNQRQTHGAGQARMAAYRAAAASGLAGGEAATEMGWLAWRREGGGGQACMRRHRGGLGN
jgi:hypothetical protein